MDLTYDESLHENESQLNSNDVFKSQTYYDDIINKFSS